MGVTFRVPPGLRIKMRLVVAIALGVWPLFGQICAPARLLPAASANGALDGDSCLLSDGSPYQPYRLDLPVRGLLTIDLPGASGDLTLILRDASGARVDSGVAIRRQVEAGSYTVLVNGQPAAYLLKTSFTAEPGILCAGYPSLGLNQSVNGSLGAAGCTMPDASPYDLYTLATFGAGTLRVTASAADFTPRVIVRTADGVPVGAETADLDANSRYEVVVYSENAVGAYQLTTAFEPSAEETCRPLATIVEPAAVDGSIGADACYADGPSYFHYYAVKVTATGIAELAASSDIFTPTLTLFDESGSPIATDSGGVSATTSTLRIRLQPGNYLVQVLSSIPSGGAYKLTYNLTPGPPAACPVAAGTLGEPQTGELTPSPCRANLYRYTLPSSGTLEVAMQSTGFAGAIELHDAKDNLMLRGTDGDEPGSSRLSADLPPGSYTVAATAQWGAGQYQLTATHTALEIPKCDFSQTLEINGGFIQKLGYRSCRDANGQPVDPYQFTLAEDSVVAAVMTSAEIDGLLTLTDSSGSSLRSDDNSYGLKDPLIVQYLRAGTYRLEARAASGPTAGYYRVDLLAIPGDRPPFCTPRGTLDLGGSIAGSIAFSRCQYRDATFADVYAFRLEQETPIDLRLDSDEFDAHLILLDAKGSVIGESDAGGDGTNARYLDQLPTGTYYVVAKPLSEYRSAGAYRLSLAAAE